MCQSPVFSTEASEMIWTMEQKPICPDCAQRITLDDIAYGYIMH